MIGALVGIKDMPKGLISKLLQYDCASSEKVANKKWPDFLSTHRVLLPNIQKLIKKWPFKNVAIIMKKLYEQSEVDE